MMRIDDLLRLDRRLHAYASLPEMDPLTEEDALQEAQLLDVRFDAISGAVAVLFELRLAIQLRESNTGVLVARGVRQLSWEGPARSAALTAWSVGRSTPRTRGELFSLRLEMWPHPGARLLLTAESAAFFAGDVSGLPEAPPDYGPGDRRAIDSEVAGWNSHFEPMSAVFLDAAPLP
jgi:hypothetical protein